VTLRSGQQCWKACWSRTSRSDWVRDYLNDGEHAMTVIRELLARPDVSLVHLRNVGYGCYNFAVRRVLHASN